MSASDGTNVVRLFKDAIRAAVAYKQNSTDIMDQIMAEIEVSIQVLQPSLVTNWLELIHSIHGWVTNYILDPRWPCWSFLGLVLERFRIHLRPDQRSQSSLFCFQQMDLEEKKEDDVESDGDHGASNGFT